MRSDYPVIEADVLVIGGGSAGAMAAIRAKEMDPRQKVVVFEKGDFRYSGCIARGMDALNIVAIPGLDSPELYVESNRIACQGVMDEPQALTMARRSFALLKKLESWGVCFPVDEKGDYEILQVHPKGKFCVTMREPDLKVKLARRALELGVRVLNRTMAARLLVTDGRIAGAIGVNVRTGEFIVCRAPAVILSAGGTARFGLPNNGHLYGVYDFPGNTGDGYMLAWRAGAELSGFEYTCSYYIVKDINAPLLYITLTRGAHLLNAFGQTFHENHPSIPMMHAEHQAHRGPMRIRMDHLPEDKIRAVEDLLFSTERPACERFYEGRGINFRSGEIELWPTETFLCGGHGQTGIRVNERAESSIPGLYAAGDTSLVARGHLTGAFTYGEIAAENATAFAHSGPRPEIEPVQLEEFLGLLAARGTQTGNPVPVEEFEYKVRRMINDYVAPPKNEYKLRRALWWMDRFRHELATHVRVRDAHDLWKTLEIENIITCAALSATASLERKESRWGLWHFRSDYPEASSDWIKHIVLRRGEADQDVRVRIAPVQRLEGA